MSTQEESHLTIVEKNVFLNIDTSPVILFNADLFAASTSTAPAVVYGRPILKINRLYVIEYFIEVGGERNAIEYSVKIVNTISPAIYSRL